MKWTRSVMLSGVLGRGVLMFLALIHYSLTGESYGSLAGTEQVERETGSLGIPQLCTITEDLYRLPTKDKSF